MQVWRHIALNTALAIPGVRRLRDSRQTSTGANATDDPDGVMIEWSDKIRNSVEAAGNSVVGAHLVEVGPGHSLGVGFCLLLDGARTVRALDIAQKCDPNDAAQFRSLADRWSEDRQAKADVEHASNGLSYALVDSSGDWPIESGTIDCVYSFFAGEHLRDPKHTLSETRRVLKAGGLCLYAVDLTSHISPEGNWLGHLYHSDRTWEAMTSRRGCWTNRVLASEWRELFASLFKLEAEEVRQRTTPPGFDSNRLASRFRDVPVEDLLIDYVWFVGRKVD